MIGSISYATNIVFGKYAAAGFNDSNLFVSIEFVHSIFYSVQVMQSWME